MSEENKQTAIKLAYGWEEAVRGNSNDIAILAELIESALNDVAAEYDEVLRAYAQDKRRLARELDVAMHGEEGAVKQASLCDLIEPARDIRNFAIEQCIKAAELEAVYFNTGGKEAVKRIVYVLRKKLKRGI